MRLFFASPGLTGLSGHHYHEAMGFRREAARRGIECRFYVKQTADADVVAALGARAIFRYGPYDLPSGDPMCGAFEDLFEVGPAFAESCRAIIADGAGRDDIVVVPMATQNELYGAALWLESIPTDRAPSVVLMFIIENYMAPRYRELFIPVAAPYRFAAKRLAARAGGRVALVAQSDVLAGRLSRLLLQPVAVFPMPHDYVSRDAGDLPAGPNTTDAPLIAVFGHSRREKGFALLPEVIRACASGGPHRFFVQVAPKEAVSRWHEPSDVMGMPNVELHFDAMDEDAYRHHFRRADIVLLPYEPSRFAAQSSGVFAEAVAMGKVVVTTANTWMAAHLGRGAGAGIVAEAYTPDAIAGAVSTAIGSFSELSAAAAACAPAWRAAQSTARFFDRMLERLPAA